MHEYKVVILGCGGVGKSALTSQMISHVFLESYDPTIEDFYRKEISVDGKNSVLEILDTAGTEQFSSMRDMYIKVNHGFLLVYSVTDKNSVHELETIRKQIVRVKGTEDVPIVVVGNKKDLTDLRQIETSDGQKMADKWNCRFYEASAKTGDNVNEVFMEIIGLIAEQHIGEGAGCCSCSCSIPSCSCCSCCGCCKKYCNGCIIL